MPRPLKTIPGRIPDDEHDKRRSAIFRQNAAPQPARHRHADPLHADHLGERDRHGHPLRATEGAPFRHTPRHRAPPPPPGIPPLARYRRGSSDTSRHCPIFNPLLPLLFLSFLIQIPQAATSLTPPSQSARPSPLRPTVFHPFPKLQRLSAWLIFKSAARHIQILKTRRRYSTFQYAVVDVRIRPFGRRR